MNMKTYKNLFFAAAFLLCVASVSVPSQAHAVDASLPVACTMDAKICPDGTTVGRVGPSCEFAVCPGSSAETKPRELVMCAQVITTAWNMTTGEKKEFPTPCDVPRGWTAVPPIACNLMATPDGSIPKERCVWATSTPPRKPEPMPRPIPLFPLPDSQLIATTSTSTRAQIEQACNLIATPDGSIPKERCISIFQNLPALNRNLPAPARAVDAQVRNSVRTLVRGMRGDDVRELQQKLVNAGLLSTEPTGFFGSMTEAALKRYQEAQGIARPGEDGHGWFGPRTRARLLAQ